MALSQENNLIFLQIGDEHEPQWILQTNIKWGGVENKKRKSWLERRRLNVRYQLLLTRHKSLKTGGHTKSQLVNEGRLVLAVDLNLDACFIGGLICGYSRPWNVTANYTDAPGNLPLGCGTQSQVLVKPVPEAYQRPHTLLLAGWTSAEQLYNPWFITGCVLYERRAHWRGCLP